MLTSDNPSEEASGLLSSFERGNSPDHLVDTAAATAVDERCDPGLWPRRLLESVMSKHPETAAPLADDDDGPPRKADTSWTLARAWASARTRKHYAPSLVAAALIVAAVVVPVVTLVALQGKVQNSPRLLPVSLPRFFLDPKRGESVRFYVYLNRFGPACSPLSVSPRLSNFELELHHSLPKIFHLAPWGIVCSTHGAGLATIPPSQLPWQWLSLLLSVAHC